VAEVVAVTSATTVLFVYGTLKRGLGNHHLLAGQEFLGEAETEPRYRVIDLRRYPGLIVDEANGLAVKGELWNVTATCIEALDDFEEAAGLFVRKPVRIPGRGLVHAYFWNCTLPSNARSGDRWPL
jgi:gamma-glutamylaminecyclotransferase